MPKFATKYTPRKTVGFTCSDCSRTEQCFKDECDINVIVRAPNQYIYPFAANYDQAQYGDFSELKDFQTAMNIVTEANNQFMRLPSELREHFNGDPQQFIDFINNPDNIEEGIKLGIYENNENNRSKIVKPVEKQEPASDTKTQDSV